MNEVNRNEKANRLKTQIHNTFSMCLVWSDYERSESERKNKQIENATHNSKCFQGDFIHNNFHSWQNSTSEVRVDKYYLLFSFLFFIFYLFISFSLTLARKEKETNQRKRNSAY